VEYFGLVTARLQRLWPYVRTYWFDVAIVVGCIAAFIELLVARESSDPDAPSDASLTIIVVASAGMTLPLLLRRKLPFVAPAIPYLVGGAVSFVAGDVVNWSFFIFLGVMSCVFLFGYLPNVRLAVAGLVLALVTVVIVVVNEPDEDLTFDLVFIWTVLAIIWFAAFALRRRFTQAEEAQQRAQSAVADERARIARELHDIVGHHVSVMTVQAGAVRRVLRPDQEKEREALTVVEQTGREALAEMRRLVGVLRRPEEAPALAPQPSLEHLDKLVEQVRDAGLPVELRVEGKPIELPPSVDLTAYRLVQEGLTNALKHARATSAEVLVHYHRDSVELTVSDDGRGGGSSDGGGHGLVGMRERVSVYGGELEAGPRPEGGYALRARLPLG
jgi:signal transduction histidine kinase